MTTNKKQEPTSQTTPIIDSAAAEQVLNGNNGKTLIKCLTVLGGAAISILGGIAFYAIRNGYEVSLSLLPPKMDVKHKMDDLKE